MYAVYVWNYMPFLIVSLLYNVCLAAYIFSFLSIIQNKMAKKNNLTQLSNDSNRPFSKSTCFRKHILSNFEVINKPTAKLYHDMYFNFLNLSSYRAFK
jgi:hypothetical protein